MPEQGPQFQRVLGEEVKRDFSQTSGLGNLKKAVEKAPDLRLVRPETVARHEADLQRVIGKAQALNRYVWDLKRHLKKDDDPEYYARILEFQRLAEKILDHTRALVEFSHKLQKNPKGDSQAHYMLQGAVSQSRDALIELFSVVEQISIEPPVSAFSRKTMQQARSNIGSIVSGFALAGVLGGAALAISSAPEAFDNKPNVGDLEKKDTKKKKEIRKEKSSGSRAFGESISLNQYGDGDTRIPGIEGGGEPGRFNKGMIIGEVDEAFFSDIDDPLWPHVTYIPDEDGRLQVVHESVDEFDTKEQALVRLDLSLAASNGKTVLPVPVGFGVGDVHLEPAIDFEFDGDTRFIIFDQKQAEEQGVYAIYSVVKVRLNIEIPPVAVEKDSDEYGIHVDLKYADADEIPSTLSNHLRWFRYVTSNDLNGMLRRMPGNYLDNLETIQVGDCDALSALAARWLRWGGKYGAVSAGVLEDDGALDAYQKHAKLVYQGEDGALQTYESTVATRDTYINLNFTPEDKEELEGIVDSMVATAESSANPEETFQYTIAFRDALRKMLESGRYEDFEPKESGSFEQFDLDSVIAQIKQLNYDIGKWPESHQILFAIFLLILAAAGSMVGIVLFAHAVGTAFNEVEGVFVDRSKRRRKQVLDDAIKIFEDMMQGVDLGVEKNEQDIEGDEEDEEQWQGKVAENIYRIYDYKFGKRTYRPSNEPMYNFREIVQWPEERQREFLKFLTMIDLLVGKEPRTLLDWFRGLSDEKRMNKVKEAFEARGTSIDDFMQIVRKIVTDPERIEERRKMVPKTVQEVFDRGKQLAVEKVEPLEKNGRATIERVLHELGTSISGEFSPKKQRPRMERGEFFDYVPYAPGMDLRSVDWHAYARSGKLYAKRSVDTRHQEHLATNINVIIDVISARDQELEGMAALLLYAQRHPQQVKISSIRFLAHGNVIDTFAQDVTRKLTRKQEVGKAVKYILTKVYQLRVDNSFDYEYLSKGLEGGRIVSDPINDLRLPPEQLPDREKYLIVGNPGIDDVTYRTKDLVTFRKKKKRKRRVTEPDAPTYAGEAQAS